MGFLKKNPPKIRKQAAIELLFDGNGAAFGRFIEIKRHTVSQMGEYLPNKHALNLVRNVPAAENLDENTFSTEEIQRAMDVAIANRELKKAALS